jgi:hypothetical protein
MQFDVPGLDFIFAVASPNDMWFDLTLLRWEMETFEDMVVVRYDWFVCPSTPLDLHPRGKDVPLALSAKCILQLYFRTNEDEDEAPPSARKAFALLTWAASILGRSSYSFVVKIDEDSVVSPLNLQGLLGSLHQAGGQEKLFWGTFRMLAAWGAILEGRSRLP